MSTSDEIKNRLDADGVLDDLITRLQSGVPVMPAMPKYGSVGAPVPDKLSDIEARIKEIQDSLSAKKEEAKKISDRDAADKIAEKLQAIVDEFNEKLQSWYDLTGCVANFSWNYTTSKKLEISAIDYIVYRKAAPSEKSIKEVLAQKEPV